MTAVVPIRFKYNTKTYWYKYGDADPKPGDWVVVSRDGGKGFGWVEAEPFELSESQESGLKSPLKSIIRVATEEDYATLEKLEEKGAESKKVFRQLAEKRGLDIKPIDVEYLMDCDRAIFHFSSEERVDFRELVRDLAATLHVHVDMRQIGVRDEARLVGGLGHCGDVLCCVRMSNGFQPVSIRMAKDQDLPLNPSKVSGACGRLMCCLRYECDAYKEFKSRAPKVGTMVSTPAGDAKVTELNTPRELVRVKMVEGDESFQVPLSGMEVDPEKDTPRPTIVTEEAFLASAPASMLRDKGIEAFTVPESELLEPDEKKGGGRRRRGKGGDNRGQGSGQGGSQQGQRQQSQGGQGSGKSGSSRRRRRKRSSGSGQGGGQQNAQKQGGSSGQRQKQRPGQNSSSIQNPSGQQASKQGSGSNSRRKRRRSGQGGQGGQNRGGQQSQQESKGGNQGGKVQGQDQGSKSSGNRSAQGSGGQQGQHGGQQSNPGSTSGSSSRKRKPRRTSGGHASEGGTASFGSASTFGSESGSGKSSSNPPDSKSGSSQTGGGSDGGQQ